MNGNIIRELWKVIKLKKKLTKRKQKSVTSLTAEKKNIVKILT